MFLYDSEGECESFPHFRVNKRRAANEACTPSDSDTDRRKKATPPPSRERRDNATSIKVPRRGVSFCTRSTVICNQFASYVQGGTEHMNSEEKDAITKLVKEYSDIFHIDEWEFPDEQLSKRIIWCFVHFGKKSCRKRIYIDMAVSTDGTVTITIRIHQNIAYSQAFEHLQVHQSNCTARCSNGIVQNDDPIPLTIESKNIIKVILLPF
ncbi:unnamed protein product [Acanthoscelides obtectus]|uniref:Uncharacterized protein n=1 Tax=Acanthoscelides obtectus TaxID=200917 RepID=A0A9P0L8T7_ACAOB|nr:unnamed protein product [Acanthoscelides obtectus]CAK1666163.1 hypothetical protein AOBTE_LOCUS25184 [Acanthoscelides obtectus]